MGRQQSSGLVTMEVLKPQWDTLGQYDVESLHEMAGDVFENGDLDQPWEFLFVGSDQLFSRTGPDQLLSHSGLPEASCSHATGDC